MACRRSRSHTTRLESPQCALALLLLCRVYGCFAGPVHVDPHVTAVWGKNVTLKCLIEVNETITQFSWEKIIGKGAQTLAVYHPRFGTSFQESYQERTTFRNHSLYDATIIISNIDFSDSGEYICKAVTFPLGNVQSSTTMTVYVEPIVSISKGSDPLLDGANETVAAFCIAAFGKPAAEVYWEESLGKMETNSTSYPNKTVTVISQYKLVPTRFARGRNITCVVRHPAFENDVRYPFKLDIQYAPEVSVTGYDGNWFVGRKNVHLKCNADSNPPPSEMKWTRLDGNWPEGLSSMNNTLLFTHPLTHNVSGTYVCSVSNILGQKSDQKTITILDSPLKTTSSLAAAGAVIGTVIALFLITIFGVVLLTPKKKRPAYLDKVIELPPMHRSCPVLEDQSIAAPVREYHYKVNTSNHIKNYPERKQNADYEQNPFSGWRNNYGQTRPTRAFINYREHYV
ncbi:nectin-3 isoform X2 [Bombina bombina]|uniref:nectin-3 isoform X2 n=1 Tax=Bombina bombina TaxID=8345 RepID=UPI00235AFA23|nr:nectin-3 isoform X2 [Bombina bombina]